MSRSIMIFLAGALAVLALISVSLLFGRDYLPISSQSRIEPTVIPTIMVETAVPTSTTSATPSATATEMPPTAVPTETSTSPAASPTYAPTSTVEPTSAQYFVAQTDINIRSGPGTNYAVIGWVAAGQMAKVTGVGTDNVWIRVICPDGSAGSCWVAAEDPYLQPTMVPTARPTSTRVPEACIDSAALVADITIADGSELAPNTGFNKTWRLENTGTCIWNNHYKVVHAGGNLMGAISTAFPLPGVVPPGETIDLTLSLVSPATPDTYQSDWKLQNPQGRYFGVGRNSSPFWFNIVVFNGLATIISGVVYQDANQNGVYNNGETLISGREIWLIPGTACHVRQDAVDTALSDNNGRYTLSGKFSGSFCIGLAGENGLDDVAGVAVAAGQVLNDIDLRANIPGGSISGFVWSDYCLTNDSGEALGGNCVDSGSGTYRADGMIQPTETYIPGVTILLKMGPCATDNPAMMKAFTDTTGRYAFPNLSPGTYCVSMNAALPENASLLLPGESTFPFDGIWYQEIALMSNDDAFPVNFGWDYELQ